MPEKKLPARSSIPLTSLPMESISSLLRLPSSEKLKLWLDLRLNWLPLSSFWDLVCQLSLKRSTTLSPSLVWISSEPCWRLAISAWPMSVVETLPKNSFSNWSSPSWISL